MMASPRMPDPLDTDPGSLAPTDAGGRRVATPPEIMPARLPAAPKRPSRPLEAASEAALTTRLERIEPDPAPLPPSPAAAEADRWLQRERPSFDAPVEVAESSDTTRPVAAPSSVHAPRVGHSTAFTALLAVTALVIGMVLGALLVGR